VGVKECVLYFWGDKGKKQKWVPKGWGVRERPPTWDDGSKDEGAQVPKHSPLTQR